jgi:hypothetical protein
MVPGIGISSETDGGLHPEFARLRSESRHE